jgi:glycosyltransferase involved in cell wall biosynthesis
MPARRILVVTYYYPPDASVGSRRWKAMVDSLRELGHDVTVVTTEAWGSDGADDYGVVRSRDLSANTRLRGLLGRPGLPSRGKPDQIQKPAPRLLADGLIPDGYLAAWAPSAAIAVRRVIRARQIDCLVTSGPPHSAHIVGLMTGKSRPAWIADFRDGWRFEPPREPWPTRVQAVADDWLERSVVRAADVAVGVTAPIADDLRERYGTPAVCVPNGWDPRVEVSLASTTVALDRSFTNVVHTGALSASGGRDPAPLIEAMWDLYRSDDPRAVRLRLVLAGRLSEADLEILRACPQNVVHIGHISPSDAFALQRQADALLLLTTVGRRSEATGKLFEYLISGRPIVALAKDNEAARIVGQTGTGIIAAPDVRNAIADALLAVVDGRLADSYEPRSLEQYIYPAPARQVAEQVEVAMALAKLRIEAASPPRRALRG